MGVAVAVARAEEVAFFVVGVEVVGAVGQRVAEGFAGAFEPGEHVAAEAGAG